MSPLQRIFPWLTLILLALTLSARANTYVVDSTASSNGGACTSAGNDCPLGAAITQSNARAGADTIAFASTVRTISLTQTLPALTDAAGLTIAGATNSNTTIERANGTLRIFSVAQNAVATLQNLNINDANANGSGGAINNAGTLSVFDCALFGNVASASGGAIYNFGGQLAVQRCTFFNNGATTGDGGAIFNGDGNGNTAATVVTDSYFENNGGNAGGAISNASDLTLRRCTFAGNASTSSQSGIAIGGGALANSGTTYAETSTFFINHAQTYGGAVLNRGALTLRSCTFSQNSCNEGGGSVANAGAGAVFGNTIFGGGTTQNVLNIAGTAGSFSSEGFNISSDGTGPNEISDKLNTDPMLDPQLTDDGVHPSYLAVSLQSPAVDGGFTAISPDVRGKARPFDIPGIANAPGGNGADVGAYEAADSAQSDSFLLVNTLADTDDGACTQADCSLREALGAASADSTISGLAFTENVRGTITLGGTALPAIKSSLAFYGPGADVLAISGDGKSGIFNLSQGGAVEFYSLTLRAGNGASGGAIGGTARNLTLNDCVLAGNNASSRGGAIYLSGASLVLDRCTLSGNNSADGGALYFAGNLTNQTATLTNCTFDNNVASGFGGAIYLFSGQAQIESNTLSANVAAQDSGGGIASFGGTNTRCQVHNSIIAGNGGGDAQFIKQTNNSFQSQGYNLVGNGNAVPGAFNQPGDQPNVGDPKLNALALNGGTTPSRLPQSDSPALNRGDTDLTFDQRVVARPQGSADDIGAVESDIRVTVSVAPGLRPSAPVTTDDLTVTPNAAASDGSTPTLFYVWRKNGEIIPNETSATLQLSKPGNGDKNDVISVEVTATLSDGTSSSGTRSVTVVNSAPVTFSGVVNAQAGVETAFAFRGADNDGDVLTFERAGGPVNGTAEIRVDPADGQLKLFYTSRARYGGTDLIKFVARDSDGRTSNVATLSINVNYVAPPPANRAPVAGDTSIDTFTGKSEVKILLGSDPDGDPLTFRLIGNAKYGSSEIKRDTDGKFKLFYTSLSKFFGPDAVTYVTVDDKNRTSNIATVSINFINRPPTAQDASFSVASGGSFSTFLFGDDPDGNDITFRQINGARQGTSEIKRDEQGKWRVYYASRAGYSGPDTINFATVDPSGRTSAIATVTINVVRVGSAQMGASAGAS